MPEIDLGYVLSLAREKLANTSDFNYETYTQILATELERRQMIELAVGGYGAVPSPKFAHAERLLVEAFCHMLYNGILIPEPDTPHPPRMSKFYVTERGRCWLRSGEPMPEDALGFMRAINELAPAIDDVIRQYIEEALITYNRQAWFASAVMLGAAAEKAVYLLAEALERSVQNVRVKHKLQTTMKERTLPNLFKLISETLENVRKQMPYELYEGLGQHLLSFFEAIRVQRNEAVHPAIAKVSPERVRMTIAAFPRALSVAIRITDWLATNDIL